VSPAYTAGSVRSRNARAGLANDGPQTPPTPPPAQAATLLMDALRVTLARHPPLRVLAHGTYGTRSAAAHALRARCARHTPPRPLTLRDRVAAIVALWDSQLDHAPARQHAKLSGARVFCRAWPRDSTSTRQYPPKRTTNARTREPHFSPTDPCGNRQEHRRPGQRDRSPGSVTSNGAPVAWLVPITPASSPSRRIDRETCRLEPRRRADLKAWQRCRRSRRRIHLTRSSRYARQGRTVIYSRLCAWSSLVLTEKETPA